MLKTFWSDMADALGDYVEYETWAAAVEAGEDAVYELFQEKTGYDSFEEFLHYEGGYIE